MRRTIGLLLIRLVNKERVVGLHRGAKGLRKEWRRASNKRLKCMPWINCRLLTAFDFDCRRRLSCKNILVTQMKALPLLRKHICEWRCDFTCELRKFSFANSDPDRLEMQICEGCMSPLDRSIWIGMQSSQDHQIVKIRAPILLDAYEVFPIPQLIMNAPFELTNASQRSFDTLRVHPSVLLMTHHDQGDGSSASRSSPNSRA